MDFNFVVVGNIVDEDGDYNKFDALTNSILRYQPKLLVVLGSICVEGTESNLEAAYEKLAGFNHRFGIAVEVTPGEGELVDGRIPHYYNRYFGEPMAAFKFSGFNFVSLDSSKGSLDDKNIDFLSRQLTVPSFVMSYRPPGVGLWKMGALEDSKEFVSVLSEKSPFVLGAFFSGIRSNLEEELVDGGMTLNIPSFLVGNSGGPSYVVGEFGYSRPRPNSALAVMVRGGFPKYEFFGGESA